MVVVTVLVLINRYGNSGGGSFEFDYVCMVI